MNNSLIQLNKSLRWKKAALAAFVLLLLVMPELSLAQAAKSFGGSINDLGVPGVSDKNSITKNLGLVMAFVGFIIILASFAFGLPETIMSFFRQLNDARKNEDWGYLMKFLGLVFMVIILAFVVIAIYNTYVVDTVNAL